MALFQQKPQAGYNLALYTIGKENTVLIVGLGNVGKEYTGTRHNIGFAAVDRFAREHDFAPWVEKKDLKCRLTSQQLSDTRVILIKPTTMMNLSGQAVQATAHFYKIQNDHIVAVYDELDVQFGQIRTRMGGGSAGHNGVKSITGAIGEEYGRVRIGIGPKSPEQMDSSDFVLARFAKEQEEHMESLTREASAILSEFAYGGELPHETRNFII